MDPEIDPAIDPALHSVLQPPSSLLSPQLNNGTSIAASRNTPHHHGSLAHHDNSIDDTGTDILQQQLEAAVASSSHGTHLYDSSPRKIASHSVHVPTSSRDAAENSIVEPARPWVSGSQKAMEMSEGNLPSQKDAVRALRKYTTLTNAEIFRRVGVSTSGGYRHLRGEPDKEPGEKHKETRGRKRKLDEDVVKRIIHEIEIQPGGEKTKSWEELCKQAGVTGIAPVTLKRAVENAGYYKCSHCQRVTKAHGMGKEVRDVKESKDGKEVKDAKDAREIQEIQHDALTEDWARKHLGV